MAAGTISVTPVGQQPTRDIFSIIGDKVKKAKEQAVEARQEADKRIEEIEGKPEEDLTQNDVIELESLKEKRSQNAYFFKKALKFQATDKIRTTMGKFQRDPELQNDPAATEKERFYAKTGMFRPGEMPDMSDREDKNKDVVSYVGKGFQLIMDAIDKIKARVNKTASSSEQTASTASSTEYKTQGVKNSTENLNNTTETISNVSKEEVKVQQMELDFEQQAEQNRNRAEAEARAEAQSDTAGVSDVKETGQNTKGGGLFSSLLKIGGKLLGGDGLGGGRLSGLGRRGAALGRLGRMRAGRMMNPARRSRQYTQPIGPQPMNSPTPWAAESGGFAPRMPSSNINLSDGGITGPISQFLPPSLGSMGKIGGAVSNGFQMLTNPTKLVGGGLRAVLPMNRNVGKDVVGGDLKETENISKLFQLPNLVGGGIMFASIAQVANAIPFLGAIVKASAPIIKPILQAYGLPASLLTMILGGGAANAATMNIDFGGGGDDGDDTNPPPGGPGGDVDPNLSGTAVVEEVSGESLAQGLGAGQRGSNGTIGHSVVGTTDQFGYLASRGRHHNGIDIGTQGQKGYMVAFKRSGKVTHAGTASGYGNLVIIKDDETDTEYYFAHLRTINPDIKVGAAYTGQTIGEIGNTGTSSGEHLHFEKRPPGSSGVDPRSDLRLLSIGKSTRRLPQNPTAQVARQRQQPAARPTGVSPGVSNAAPTPNGRNRRGGAGSGTPASPGEMAQQASVIGVPGVKGKTPQNSIPQTEKIAFSVNPALNTDGLWPSSFG